MHPVVLLVFLALVACAAPVSSGERPRVSLRLCRVILPVSDVAAATRFYAAVLQMPGERVSPGRHYFDCGGTILACCDPRADGDDFDARPNPDHVYLAVDDLDALLERARATGCKTLDESIEWRPWGERSFYCQDPFGNPLCFVDAATVFLGRGGGDVGDQVARSRKPARSEAVLTTVAFRVHEMREMAAFYAEAFGAQFRTVETGPFYSRFGEVRGLTLKFVPIRSEADFEDFPVHQLGFEVDDVDAVIAAATRHGGRVQNSPQRTEGRVHAAIRDPDGNTIELYGRR
jgi:predicted enzyme related to lactoylglutathione lyase